MSTTNPGAKSNPVSDPSALLDPPGPRVRVSVGEAMRRNWRLLVAPVLALVFLALVIGWARGTTYTSQAELQVGGPVSTDFVSQFVNGTNQLAGVYARLIDSEPVVQRVAEQLEVEPGSLAGRLSATPIPESPIVRVEATGDSADSAIELANAASGSLAEQVEIANTSRSRSDELLAEVADSEKAARDALALRDAAQGSFDGNPTAANESRLSDAQGALTAADLKLATAKVSYQEAESNRVQPSELQLLTAADTASSDRLSRLQTLLFFAIVGGLAIGGAMAVMRENYPGVLGGLLGGSSRSRRGPAAPATPGAPSAPGASAGNGTSRTPNPRRPGLRDRR